MLTRLTIRDFVLAKHIDLALGSGLTAFTGETGAGKSILLDALALLCGGRADVSMIRTGTNESVLSALFELPATHPACTLLAEAGIETDDGQLLIRRHLSADGRSKAFINDTACTAAFLKQLGELLVDIHGQFDTLGLLDEKAARGLLDAYGAYPALLARVKTAYETWHTAQKALAELEKNRDTHAREAEWLDAALKELTDLSPEKGEEDDLLARRKRLQNLQTLENAYSDAEQHLEQEEGALILLHRATRILERLGDKADETVLKDIVPLLAEAHEKANEAAHLLSRLRNQLHTDDNEASLDDRLYALRSLARKHSTTCDALIDLIPLFNEKRAAIGNVDGAIQQAQQHLDACLSTYQSCAQDLTEARHKAAKKLQKQVQAELSPLKLAKAQFNVSITPLNDIMPNVYGVDEIAFLVTTNEGQAAGPLGKIASGGELSRFMLALKLVLGASSPVCTMVFDEIDSGMGGATASAIGDRLRSLGSKQQTLIVTHAPQVAAYAQLHLKVRKESAAGTTTSFVDILPSQAERTEELARMLAGQNLSAEARLAATRLLTEANPKAA